MKPDPYFNHYRRLIGATIRGIVQDTAAAPETTYGLEYERRDHLVGKPLTGIAWILRDPEGNGPGFLEFEEERTAS